MRSAHFIGPPLSAGEAEPPDDPHVDHPDVVNDLPVEEVFPHLDHRGKEPQFDLLFADFQRRALRDQRQHLRIDAAVLQEEPLARFLQPEAPRLDHALHRLLLNPHPDKDLVKDVDSHLVDEPDRSHGHAKMGHRPVHLFDGIPFLDVFQCIDEVGEEHRIDDEAGVIPADDGPLPDEPCKTE